MIAYARHMQLAVSDIGRRVAFKAVAVVLALIAVGFLIAALWTFFAYTLLWGPLWASVAVAVLFLVVAGILWAVSSKVKHPVPPVEELKREVEARVSLATDVALAKAQVKAREVIDMAGNKATGLMDEAAFRANMVVDSAEAKVQRLTHEVEDKAHRFVRETPTNVAHSVGLTPQFFSEAQQFTDKVKSSKAVPAASLLGAFAVGLTLASKLRTTHQDDWEDEDFDQFDDEDYDDEWDDDLV